MISAQSVIIAIVYILCLIVAIVAIIKQNMLTIGSGVVIIFYLAFIALLVYDTNCLTKGTCGTWSWIRTILYVIFPIISLIAALIALLKTNENEKNKNKFIS